MSYYVDWSKFSWEAFATLATGFAAVAGAIVIGRRQLAINERQIVVAARQARAEELALRAELFDRRLAVYRAVKAYLRHAGSLRTDSLPDVEVWQKFAEEMEQAQFLFDGSTQQRLHEVATDADDLLQARQEARDARAAQAPDVIEKGNRALALNRKLRDNVASLPALLGAEMNLYISPEPTPFEVRSNQRAETIRQTDAK